MTNKNKQVAEKPQEEPQVSATTGAAYVEEPAPQTEPTAETVPSNKVDVRCPDCPWKPGLKDEYTVCSTCEGSGTVKADPLE